MRSLSRLISLALLLGGWFLAASAIHVIRAPQTIVIVPKDRLGLTDTYVDVRDWTVADVDARPALIDRLIRAERDGLLDHIPITGGIGGGASRREATP